MFVSATSPVQVYFFLKIFLFIIIYLFFLLAGQGSSFKILSFRLVCANENNNCTTNIKNSVYEHFKNI